MSQPILTPASTTSTTILSASATPAEAAAYAFKADAYATNQYFLSGAADQVSYTYKRLGGDVLDIEIVNDMVFEAYEEAVVEYSYLVNIHQAKNALPSLLGDTTGSFDHTGQLISGDSLENINVELKYPRFEMPHPKRVGIGLGREGGFGGDAQIHTGSFTPVVRQQEYDLQALVSDSHPTLDIGNKRIVIQTVYYKTPRTMWRFFSYYGGLNVVGNLMDYGQYSDRSTYEIVPTWQNKLQAMQFEDSLYTRTSHYSYDVINNRLRIFPTPEASLYPDKIYFRFYVPADAWVEEADRQTGTSGINNMNTLPFANVPYTSINSIGKQWIRRYGFSVAKRMLGRVRSKLDSLPFSGQDVTLDGKDLISEATEEQEKLREELKTVLDELTYNQVAENQAKMVEDSRKAIRGTPLKIYVG